MDNRKMLESGYLLSFPGMDCKIDRIIGKGANAIVYLGSYEDSISKGNYHHVVVKELFPYHPENLIFRNADGRIEIAKEAQDYYALHRKSFEYGNKIHLQLLEAHPDKISANINTFSLNDTFYSILAFDSGKSLDKIVFPETYGLKNSCMLIKDLLEVVTLFHKEGYLHLDISPDNILLLGDGEARRISLIDYNSVHKISELQEGSVLYCSAKEGYSAPEVLSGNVSAFCEGSDIYSVAAVFYWMLTGNKLSFYQSLRQAPPDIRNCAVVQNLPETVVARIVLILKRGLCNVPSKRYKNCERMLEDITELLSRIDGIGITHAALWESSRRIIEKTINTNTSLQYLKNIEELYPLRLSDAQHNCTLLPDEIEKTLQRGSVMINGAAGTGKTTTLLHTAAVQCQHYSPAKPVAIYISLFTYNSNGENFIKNRILEDLKFDSSINNMEDARNRLIKEFNTPLKTKDGEKPGYILLVDGFNEAGGDIQPLIKEILSLSQLNSVRIILSSRSRTDVFPFSVLSLAPLTQNDIKTTLEKNFLIYPESIEMQKLLSTPIMLSMFCKAAKNKEKQLDCDTSAALIQAYLEGICEKEIKVLPEQSGERWLIDSAVHFVLPFICAEICKKNTAVTDKDLLKIIKKCYRLVTSGRLAGLIPAYIGHCTAIKADTENVDEWYGKVVINLLWRRMGLLVKEPDRGYKLMHQLLQDELLSVYSTLQTRLKKRYFLRFSFFFSSVLAVIVALTVLLSPDPFDEELSRTYLDSIVISQVQSGTTITTLSKLLATDEKNLQEIEKLAAEIKTKIAFHQTLLQEKGIGSPEMTENIYQQLKDTGTVMPWSAKSIDEDTVASLFQLSEEITQNYGFYADILQFLLKNEELNRRFGKNFRQCMEEKICADATLSDALFYLSCTVHLDGMKKKNPDVYDYYWMTIGANADLSNVDPQNPDKANIERLQQECKEKNDRLNELEIITIYRRMNK